MQRPQSRSFLIDRQSVRLSSCRHSNWLKAAHAMENHNANFFEVTRAVLTAVRIVGDEFEVQLPEGVAA